MHNAPRFFNWWFPLTINATQNANILPYNPTKMCIKSTPYFHQKRDNWASNIVFFYFGPKTHLLKVQFRHTFLKLGL